jgi:hypothetical protein
MKRNRLRVPRVPKPKRRIGKSGKEVGNYYIRSHGAEINLATRDPDEAIRRSTEYAKTGKSNWLEDEVGAARATIEAMNTDAPVAPPTPAGVAPAPAQPPPAAQQPAPSPAPSPAAPAPAPAPPKSPPAPPPSSPPRADQAAPQTSPEDEADEADEADEDWSDDAQQAAEETAQQQDAEPPKGPQAAPGFKFDPQTIEMIVKTAAANAVDYQLLIQAVLIKKKTGDDAPMISHESLSWQLPYSIWEGQFRHWLSNVSLDRVPPWLAAILLTALMAKGQYTHRQKPKPKGSLGIVQDAEWSEPGSERKAA